MFVHNWNFLPWHTSTWLSFNPTTHNKSVPKCFSEFSKFWKVRVDERLRVSIFQGESLTWFCWLWFFRLVTNSENYFRKRLPLLSFQTFENFEKHFWTLLTFVVGLNDDHVDVCHGKKFQLWTNISWSLHSTSFTGLKCSKVFSKVFKSLKNESRTRF